MHEEFTMVFREESCATSPLVKDTAVQVSRAFNLARHSLWDRVMCCVQRFFP